MGDIIKNSAVFSKLGFDSSNQWILYNEPLQNFFNWLARNITDSNILHYNETFTQSALGGTWNEDDKLSNRLKNLEEAFPGILTYTEQDARELQDEIEELEFVENSYSELNAMMKKTCSDLNRELSDLELTIQESEEREEKAYSAATEKANELQELQKSNLSLTNELNGCFSKQETPPLFIHQMPLEDFFTKSHSFQQYLMMYMNHNCNIKPSISLEDDDDIEQEESKQIIEQLDSLQKQLFGAELQHVKIKLRSAEYRKMNEELDINRVYAMNIAQLKKEARDFELNNKQHFGITYDTLMNDLKVHLQQLVHQQMDFISYENTKIKLERASQRLENVKSRSRQIFKALHNAEVLWILMQLDLEKVKSRYETPAIVINDNQSCSKRIETMLQFQSISNNLHSKIFINRMSEQLNEYLQSQKSYSIKTCLYEYERFCRLSIYSLKGLIDKKHCNTELKILERLESTENIFCVYVFDGPIDGPMFENMKFLESIYKAKDNKNEIEKRIRQLRCEIQTNITEKMNTDRFWGIQQILWIWFLTEPKKIQKAIEEISKAASKTSNFKTLCGIKRKE